MAAKRFARTTKPIEGQTDMATAAPTLEATAPTSAADLEATPATNANLIKFSVDDYDTPVEVSLEKMPAEVRQRLMYNATRSYVLNRVSTAVAAAKKANGPFDTYEAAQRTDPMQTTVLKPEGERKVVKYAEIIEGAINALYSGEIGKRGAGTSKVAKDPLTEHVTRVVVSEIYAKEHAKDPSYKFFKAQAIVKGDGIAYLKSRIAENVRDFGVDEKQQLDILEQRYLKPARITLGLEELGGKLKGVDGIL